MATNGRILICVADDGGKRHSKYRNVNPRIESFACYMLEQMQTQTYSWVPVADVLASNPGVAPSEPSVEVLGTAISLRHMALLSDLPDCRLGVLVGDRNAMVAFKFSGGFGALVPHKPVEVA